MTDRTPPLALPPLALPPLPLPAPALSAPAEAPSDPGTADAAADDPLGFVPVVPRHAMHNGWTAERQRGFIQALADTGSVQAACDAVGMRTGGAYRLRRQPGAEGFRAAWAAALDHGVQRVEDVAMDRALNGVEQPVYSYGKLIGTRTVHNDRLLMFMLRNRSGDRFGGDAGPRGNLNMGRLNDLKAEWRREWKEEQARDAEAARVKILAELDLIAERLGYDDDGEPAVPRVVAERDFYRSLDPRHQDPDWVPPWEEGRDDEPEEDAEPEPEPEPGRREPSVRRL